MQTSTHIQFETILTKYLPGISREKIDHLAAYADLLSEWNEKINLVSRKEQQNIWNNQVIGSVLFLFQYRLEEKFSLVDIGTGGGLPGIPLAILYPDSKFLLVDSIQKKITAVDDMITRLGLNNARAICSRAEELSRKPEHAGKYDYVMARAVAPVVDIIRWGRPFVQKRESAPIDQSARCIPTGTLMMLKGGDLLNEIQAATVKWKPKQIVSLNLNFVPELPELTEKKLVLVKT